MRQYQVCINGRELQVELVERAGNRVMFSVEGNKYDVTVEPKIGPATQQSSAPVGVSTPPAPLSKPRAAAGKSGPGAVVAPIPGIVVAVPVKIGDTVTAGQTVVVLEAMKMENAIGAPSAGTVAEILVAVAGQVEQGQVLVRLTA